MEFWHRVAILLVILMMMGVVIVFLNPASFFVVRMIAIDYM